MMQITREPGLHTQTEPSLKAKWGELLVLRGELLFWEAELHNCLPQRDPQAQLKPPKPSKPAPQRDRSGRQSNLRAERKLKWGGAGSDRQGIARGARSRGAQEPDLRIRMVRLSEVTGERS
jgi:hypothetical protein